MSPLILLLDCAQQNVIIAALWNIASFYIISDAENGINIVFFFSPFVINKGNLSFYLNSAFMDDTELHIIIHLLCNFDKIHTNHEFTSSYFRTQKLLSAHVHSICHSLKLVIRWKYVVFFTFCWLIGRFERHEKNRFVQHCWKIYSFICLRTVLRLFLHLLVSFHWLLNCVKLLICNDDTTLLNHFHIHSKMYTMQSYGCRENGWSTKCCIVEMKKKKKKENSFDLK